MQIPRHQYNAIWHAVKTVPRQNFNTLQTVTVLKVNSISQAHKHPPHNVFTHYCIT